MEKLTRIGMDTSKQIFQLHGVDEAEQPVLRKRLRRGQVLGFFAQLAPTKVGIEACGAAHYWARALSGLGHEVALLAPQYVKPYVKRGKNDAADAEAICEAMSRPAMRFVAPKSAESQAGLMLAGVRDSLIARRTQLTNTIRGYAAEFGLVAAKGLDKIEPLLARLAGEETLPALARAMFATLAEDHGRLRTRLAAIDKQMMAFHKASEQSRRLAGVPGVGPIGAALMTLKTPDPAAFKSARHYAAWLGLTPKDHSTAGKQRLGVITRAGDATLRRLLVVGAMAVIRQARARPERAWPWLQRLIARKPLKLAAVALANKNARTAWKMMTTGEAYDASRRAPVGAAQIAP